MIDGAGPIIDRIELGVAHMKFGVHIERWPTLRPFRSVFTIGIEETAGEMAAKASAAGAYDLLKIKLDGVRPAERLEAICRSHPDARIVVDANQGWSFSQLRELAPICASLGVEIAHE
jgi:L-Ala-D/L-Glu epimerase